MEVLGFRSESPKSHGRGRGREMPEGERGGNYNPRMGGKERGREHGNEGTETENENNLTNKARGKKGWSSGN